MGYRTSRILYGNTDNMKQRLIKSFFTDYKRHALVEGCRVNLKEASQFLDCLSSDDDPILTQYVFDYIERCYSCIVISWQLPNRSQRDDSAFHREIQREAGNSSAQKPFDNYLVIPSRFEEFLTVNKSRSRPFHFKIVVHKVQALISYCHLQGILYPTNTLIIDAIMFLESQLWNTYVAIRDKAIQSSTSGNSTVPPPTIHDPLPIDKPIPLSSPADVITDTNQLATTSPSSSSSMVDQHRSPDGVLVPSIDPTCPFLQDILSPVEHLKVMSFDNFGLSHLHKKTFDQYSIDVPSFIMHNIVSQENPHLKSIHIDGNVQVFADSFVTLDTVTAYLCGQADGPRYLQDDKGNRYSLMPPSKPYFIEKLSISVAEFNSFDFDFIEKLSISVAEFYSGDNNFQFILECHTASISRNVRKIIKCQESTLQSISLKEHIGFAHKSFEDFEIINPEEYCSLVQTTFIDFIRFPQFKSLELDDSPDQICHPLVMAFLSTPATHERYLAISLKPDARSSVSKDWYLGCDISTSLPESNFEYKSLNLEGKESQVIKHLLSFPHLSLKSFSLSTHHLSADSTSPSTVNIQCFTLHLKDDKFTSSKLDSFICKNPPLTTFIISMQTVNRIDRFHILGFEKIIICLVRLVRKQATLDSVVLEGTQLLDDDYRTKSQSSHFSGKQPASNQYSKKSDFDEEYPAIIQWFPNSVTRASNHDNIDLVMFFYLVQKLDATLTIKAKYRFRELPSDIIPVLVHAEIMIRKVTLKGLSAEQWKDEFSKIAKIVESIDSM